MITARAVDKHVDQLFEVLQRLHAALTKAGIRYRVVGGLGVFLQVSERNPLAARLTRDADIAVDRKDLQRIAAAVGEFGFRYRHAANVDMLVDAANPKAHSAVRFVFVGPNTWSPSLVSLSQPSRKKGFYSRQYRTSCA